MKHKFFRKFFSFFLSFLLLFQSSSPYLAAFAQEATESVIQTISEPTPEPLAPTETGTPAAELASTPSPVPTPEPTIEPSPTPTPVVSLWQTNSDGAETTAEVVSLNQTYQAPQNDKVTITFTKLPENPGTLTIKEIKLTPEQIEELGAFSETAYEITSTMQDGTFTYDLMLPLPDAAKGKDVEVKSGETIDEVITNAEVVSEPKKFSANTITIRGLDHFTIFVLVNNVVGNDGDEGTSDDIANGVLSAIEDTWVDEDNPTDNNGTDTALEVRSDDTPANRRAFVKFDTSEIPADSEVTQATLRLFLSSAPDDSLIYQVSRVTANWTEDSLDWDPQPSNAGETDVADIDTVNNVWVEWDVTSDVQGFLDGDFTNYGWVIKDDEEDADPDDGLASTFRSSEYTGNRQRRPQLVVDFAAPDNQPTDYKSPTASAATSGGDGNGFESSSPSNAFADSGGVATNLNGAGDRHLFYNYDPFAIPDGSTINGIEVRTDWRLDATGGINSLDIELSWDGGASWTDPKSDITETDKEHVSSLGGASDTWGRDWNGDEFTNDNFRVRVTSNSDSSSRDFYLDWIPVRVYYTEAPADTTPPVSEFTSPYDGFVTNDPIYVAGSSTDVPDTTVEVVNVYARISGSENWGDPILTFENESGDEPFNWADYWTPGADGDYDFKVSAIDDSENVEESDYVYGVVYDTTAPASDITFPENEVTYSEDSWNDIQGTAEDSPSSGVSTVYVSIQADNGDYWCDENECGDGYGWYSEDEGETLNEADFNDGEWSYEFDFISEEGTQGYTVRSHAEDNAGNLEETNTVHFYFQTDTTPPVSTIDSPQEGTFWNEPIEIAGSSTDIPNTTVDYVNFYYRTSGEEENPWSEIPGSQQDNTDDEPFDWSFNWTPDSEGTFDIKAKATDKAGNVENSSVVEYVTYDVTGPVVSTPLASPDPTNHQPQILADAVDAISNIVSAIFSVNDPDFLFAKPLEALDGFFDSLAETLFGPEFDNGMDYPGEGLHTLYVGAYDQTGNFGSNSGPFIVDTIAPVSSFSSPEDGFTTNLPIEISGSSSDESEDTVDFVQLFYRESIGEGEEENEWTEIEQLTNFEGAEPFEWSFTWTPPANETFDIKAEATDTAGNLELSPVISDVVYDTTAPVASWISPTAGATISGSASLDISATDALSGVASIQYQYRRDNGIDIFHDISGSAWDTTGLALDTYTLRAIITDKAGNSTTIDRLVEVAAVVTAEAGSTPTGRTISISWTTDRPTSGRIVYDTVSHPVLGAAPNYGYAFSSGTVDSSPKSTTHSITLSDLSEGTIYYWRTVSSGSPTAIGNERTNRTFSAPGVNDGGGGGGGGGVVAGISTIFTPPTTLFTAQFIPVEEILGEATVSGQPTPQPEADRPLADTPQVQGASTFNWWYLFAGLGLLGLVVSGFFLWRRP